MCLLARRLVAEPLGPEKSLTLVAALETRFRYNLYDHPACNKDFAGWFKVAPALQGDMPKARKRAPGNFGNTFNEPD